MRPEKRSAANYPNEWAFRWYVIKTSGKKPPNSAALKWSNASCRPLYSIGVMASGLSSFRWYD
jgi:hypothetical protein